MGEQFLIKYRSTGQYFHPEGGQVNPANETPIVLNKYVHKRMYWTFEKVRDQWGYIKHVESGKIIHPQGGAFNPSDSTQLVLSDGHHDGALFALDTFNHRIIHLSGRFAQPVNFLPNPHEETRIILHSNSNDATRFLFVSPNNTSEVPVYGKPTAVGKWEIVSMVRNPSAEHIDKVEIKVGKSRSESKKTQIEVSASLELSGKAKIKEIFKLCLGVSVSFKYMFEKTSSSTWYDETTRTREIRVKPGCTVVTWQYVFTFEHGGAVSSFNSNLLADTESDSKPPKDVFDDDEVVAEDAHIQQIRQHLLQLKQ